MSSGLESQVEQTLVDRADRVDAVGFDADTIFRAGRAARKRHRRITLATAATGIVAVAVVAVSALTSGGTTSQPVPPGLATPPPTASAPPPAIGLTREVVTPKSLALSYAVGARITPADGAPFTVGLPAGSSIFTGRRVPGGWLLTVGGPGDGNVRLFWQPDTGPSRDLDSATGNWVVTADGTTLVVSKGTDGITAYRLPALERIDTGPYAPEPGTSAVGVAGDWVLLNVAVGDYTIRKAVAWNLITGETRETPAGVDIWGMSADGRVLRRVWLDPARGCVDLVPLADLTTIAATGYCGPELMERGLGIEAKLSPNGQTFVLTRSGRPSVVLRTNDIHNGQWIPVATINRDVHIFGWLTGSAMLAISSNAPVDPATYACTLDGCAKIDLPKEFFDLGLIYGTSG